MALDALALESFVEYAIGTTLLIVRLFARLWTVGFGGLWWDDLLTLLAIVSLLPDLLRLALTFARASTRS